LPVFREAVAGDDERILELYGQLHPEDPALLDASSAFDLVRRTAGVRLLVLEDEGRVVATTYLNVIPNLTRGGAPYAVIENVVVDECVRGHGLGRRIMAATLREAWDAGCYKAMLMTGSSDPRTHAFYRSCGFSPEAKTAYLARPR
jgi:GNAT superfamily N-acetyltransferase